MCRFCHPESLKGHKPHGAAASFAFKEYCISFGAIIASEDLTDFFYLRLFHFSILEPGISSEVAAEMENVCICIEIILYVIEILCIYGIFRVLRFNCIYNDVIEVLCMYGMFRI